MLRTIPVVIIVFVPVLAVLASVLRTMSGTGVMLVRTSVRVRGSSRRLRLGLGLSSGAP